MSHTILLTEKYLTGYCFFSMAAFIMLYMCITLIILIDMLPKYHLFGAVCVIFFLYLLICLCCELVSEQVNRQN